MRLSCFQIILAYYLTPERIELANGLGATFGGQVQASPHTKAGALPFRVLCENAGPLADIAAADQPIHAKLLTTTRLPARLPI